MFCKIIPVFLLVALASVAILNGFGDNDEIMFGKITFDLGWEGKESIEVKNKLSDLDVDERKNLQMSYKLLLAGTIISLLTFKYITLSKELSMVRNVLHIIGLLLILIGVILLGVFYYKFLDFIKNSLKDLAANMGFPNESTDFTFITDKFSILVIISLGTSLLSLSSLYCLVKA